MAVVLPQGRLNNSSDKQIREFIAENCRILGVVGLHGNVFKPHAGVKTSVLLVQKWNDNASHGVLCPKQDDYPIFFATMQQPSKDNSGDKIFVKNTLTRHYREMVEAGTLRSKSSPNGNPLDLQTEKMDSHLRGNDGTGEFLLDTHGHLIVKHDLFNHDGITQDGITEAFIEFAKKERLSFFQ